MIKKLLATSALVAVPFMAVPFMAEAADFPVEAPVLASTPMAFSWAGGYLGGTFGYGSAEIATPGGNPNVWLSGPVGGLHGGYNWQSGNLVYGLEADVGAAAIAGHTPGSGSSTSTAFSSHLTATLRGRLGITFDRNLIYGTGGLSYLNAQIDTDDNSAETTNHNIFGYVVGGGWEHAYNNNLIFRIEGLFHGYNQTLPYSCGGGTCSETAGINGLWTARVGLSYKF